MSIEQDDLATVSVAMGILVAICTGMFRLFKKSSKIDDNESDIVKNKEESDKKIQELREYHEKSISEVKKEIEDVKNSEIKKLEDKVESLTKAFNDSQSNLTSIMTKNLFVSLLITILVNRR